MKVQCPKCASEYNMDPAKIPDTGAKVRCPSCSNVFEVTKSGVTGGEDEPVALDDEASDAVHSEGAGESLSEAAQAGLPRGAFTGEGEWRVKKSGLGLVYGPADFGTVESWIRAERIGAQDLYSLDGSDWQSPSAFQIIAEKLQIPYQGPARPANLDELKAATPAAPKPKPAAPKPAAKPAPAATSRAAAPAPAGGGAGFDLPEDDFDISSSLDGGGDKKKWIIIGVAAAVVIGGLLSFYLLVINDPKNYAGFYDSAPSALRPVIEMAFGTPLDESEGADSKKLNDPLRQLTERFPQKNRKRFHTALSALFRDTAEGYDRALSTFENMKNRFPSEALQLSALISLTNTLRTVRIDPGNGDFKGLLIKAETIKDASPSDPIALDNYALALLVNGNLEEAANAASDSLQRRGDDAIAYYIRAQARPPGTEDLESALKIRSRFVMALIQLARVRLAEKKLDEASSLIDRALHQAPGHPEATRFLEEQLKPALAGKPAVSTSQPVAQTASAEGAQAENGGNTDTEDAPALPQVTTSIISTKVEEEKSINDPVELFEQAKKDFTAQDYDAAEKHFIRLLDDFYDEAGQKNVALTHYYLAEIYRFKKDYEKSRAQYEASLAVAPNFGTAKKRLEELKALQ